MTWKLGSNDARLIESDKTLGQQRFPLAPVGTAHAVDFQAGEVACGRFSADELVEIDALWESSNYPDKCSDCVKALSDRNDGG
jgi:hypothetical protein